MQAGEDMIPLVSPLFPEAAMTDMLWNVALFMAPVRLTSPDPPSNVASQNPEYLSDVPRLILMTDMLNSVALLVHQRIADSTFAMSPAAPVELKTLMETMLAPGATPL